MGSHPNFSFKSWNQHYQSHRLESHNASRKIASSESHPYHLVLQFCVLKVLHRDTPHRCRIQKHSWRKMEAIPHVAEILQRIVRRTDGLAAAGKPNGVGALQKTESRSRLACELSSAKAALSGPMKNRCFLVSKLALHR